MFDFINGFKELKHSSEDSFMLTTIDNPFNPFTNFDRWLEFDRAKGYFTCEYLDRIVPNSDYNSEADEDLLINHAMDRIVEVNPLNIYRKVSKNSKFLEEQKDFDTTLTL